MQRFIHIFLISLIFNVVYSQPPLKTESKRAIKYYDLGRTNYELQYYELAEQNLLDAINTDKDFQNAYLVLAEVYWDQQKYAEAVQYYAGGLAIDSSFYPRGFFNKGKLEIKIARYADARESFRTFLRLAPKNTTDAALARKGIRQAQFGLHAMQNPVEFEPVNLGPSINTRSEEYWPSLSADGQTLVITRLVEVYDVIKGKSIQEDFFFSRLENGQWTTMKNAGPPLNTPDNEGAQSISADGNLMVYTVCNRKGVIGRCDIYYSERSGEEWSQPKNLGEPINTTAKETQPSLSADGRTLYFASDRPGGKGNLDIWVSTRNNEGVWSKPKNLGDSINTPGDEMSPFIHHDSKTLYFSSDSHIGMGGFDLYLSRMDDEGEFKEITNLGYPINTSDDEIGLIVNAKGNMAYYASNRDKMSGKDIFQFNLYEEARPQEVSYLKGMVFDDQSLKRLRAEFELYSLLDGELISRSYSDERSGEFLLCIPTNQNYMLNVDKKGYLFYSDNFSLEGIYHLDEPFLKDVPLKPLRSGESVVLRNIFYETDSYSLKEESEYELDKLVRFLSNNPSLRIEISGHTDTIGGELYNMTLSGNRAKSVVEYLTAKGIAIDRLSYKGYGYSVPLESNDTPEGRAKNRRTELKILD